MKFVHAKVVMGSSSRCSIAGGMRFGALLIAVLLLQACATVPKDKMILDIGPDSAAALAARLADTKTQLWNGPLGAFEFPPFDKATVIVAQAAAAQTKAGTLVSVAGGGDTVAALRHAGVAGDFTYVSTAGGAFLEWLEGRELPGVAALQQA